MFLFLEHNDITSLKDIWTLPIKVEAKNRRKSRRNYKNIYWFSWSFLSQKEREANCKQIKTKKKIKTQKDSKDNRINDTHLKGYKMSQRNPWANKHTLRDVIEINE